VKDVSDNIAHDLRTPLYRLRSKIELALIRIEKEGAQNGPRDALELALKEADRLLGTFNALLSIARLEAGAMRDNFDEVSLVDIVRDVAELYEPVAEDRTLRLETTAEPGLIIRANRALIVQALSNLVDNALKYSPHGTRVSIGAERAVPGRLWRDAVDLFVADQGPGIAVEDRERVLERFVRLDRGHGAPGSGLGLSLVSAIARLHDAALILEDGADGIGLTARLRFASS
jgi:signal transduction histidine kinase